MVRVMGKFDTLRFLAGREYISHKERNEAETQLLNDPATPTAVLIWAESAVRTVTTARVKTTVVRAKSENRALTTDEQVEMVNLLGENHPVLTILARRGEIGIPAATRLIETKMTHFTAALIKHHGAALLNALPTVTVETLRQNDPAKWNEISANSTDPVLIHNAVVSALAGKEKSYALVNAAANEHSSTETLVLLGERAPADAALIVALRLPYESDTVYDSRVTQQSSTGSVHARHFLPEGTNAKNLRYSADFTRSTQRSVEIPVNEIGIEWVIAHTRDTRAYGPRMEELRCVPTESVPVIIAALSFSKSRKVHRVIAEHQPRGWVGGPARTKTWYARVTNSKECLSVLVNDKDRTVREAAAVRFLELLTM
jgi:hypothetical protein